MVTGVHAPLYSSASGETLAARGVRFKGRTSRQRWGLVTRIVMPGGATLGLYEPARPRRA